MTTRSKRRRFGPTGFEEAGGYMSAKIQKLENQFLDDAEGGPSASESKEPPIFKGISVFVNGYTDPSAEEIRRIMMVYGGTYQHYYKRKAKCYMIATNLPMAKLKDLKDYVVKPSWITDSVDAGKLLPVLNYLLYSPGNKKGQQTINNLMLNEPSTSTTTSAVIKEFQEEEGFLSSEHSDEKDTCEELHSVHDAGLSSSVQERKESEAHRFKPGDTKFLQEFYGRSRLHHISTASLKLRDYVSKLRSTGSQSVEALDRLKNHLKLQSPRKRTIPQGTVLMHVDMDCFFVSVGLRSRPHLKGQPVAVCHGKSNGSEHDANHGSAGSDGQSMLSRSEVASCSYEARDAGVRSGMYLGQAKKLCPNITAIPYDFESYDAVSKQLYDIVASYTLDIEAVSCDELYADVTSVLQDAQCTPEEFAGFLRKEIVEKTQCTASVGLGSNMLAARVANRSAKPNGHRFVQTSQLLNFFKSVPVKHLPGVGYRLQSQLSEMGIEVCEQLQALSMETLKSKFGVKTGDILYRHARGLDDRSLQFNKVRKSVSAEVNYGIRFKEVNDMNQFIVQLSDEVEKRLNEAGVQGRALTLKLKIRQKDAPLVPAKFMGHGMCDNIAKSVQLMTATSSSTLIGRECCSLAAQLSLTPSDLRGVGIQVGKLEPRQPSSSHHTKTMLDFMTTSKAKAQSAAMDTANATVEDGPASLEVPVSNLGIHGSPSKAVSLPNFSEIDPSVFESLPDDIREEVLEMYQGNQHNLRRGNREAVNSAAGASTSAPKAKLPTGKRRGRPPKNASPQKACPVPCHSLKEYMASVLPNPSSRSLFWSTVTKEGASSMLTTRTPPHQLHQVGRSVSGFLTPESPFLINGYGHLSTDSLFYFHINEALSSTSSLVA